MAKFSSKLLLGVLTTFSSLETGRSVQRDAPDRTGLSDGLWYFWGRYRSSYCGLFVIRGRSGQPGVLKVPVQFPLGLLYSILSRQIARILVIDWSYQVITLFSLW